MSAWQQVTWDSARAGGLTAFALLTLSVVAGMLASLRVSSPRWPRFVTAELHNFLTLLALVFAGLHVAAVAVDPFTRFGLADVLVPLAGPYRPAWMALGIVALYLGIAVWVSTLLRGRIGYARWRRFHAVTFLVFAAALVHGLATGTDTRTAWAGGLYAVAAALVTGLLLVRLLRTSGGRPRPGTAALTILGAVAGLAWVAEGPMAAGWGARAGSRAEDGPAHAARSRPAAPRPAGDPFARGFDGAMVGILRREGLDGSGQTTIRLGSTLRGRPRGLLEVVLHGPPADGGGVVITATRVLLGTGPGRELYDGQVTALAGNDIRAVVRRTGPGARALGLHIVLTGMTDGRVRGTVHAQPVG